MPTILDKFNLKDRVAVVTGGAGLLGVEDGKRALELALEARKMNFMKRGKFV